MKPRPNRETLLSLLREKAKRPISFKDIARLMGLDPPGARAMKKVLRALVREGSIVRTRQGRYGPPEEMEMVTGYFEAYPDGYGFVISEKPGERDIFIPPDATLSAMDNDRVMASVVSRRRRKGRIVRILERAHTRIAGTVDMKGALSFVTPKRKSVNFDIFIPPEKRKNAVDNEDVIVEITEYPSAKRPATGRIVKVLGPPESPKDEVSAIIQEFNLPGRFPPDTKAQARQLRDKKLDKRYDLRGLGTITIDGENAKDFDDAVSIRADKDGYTLWVHIADVGFYVGWDTPLDLEARKRGTSVYFPDRVVPMLPKELSEDLCSLRPGEDKAAFTVEMRFNRSGARIGEKFYPSLIVSDERMTYTNVKNILVDRDEEVKERYSGLVEDLEHMAVLAKLLRGRRMKRGSLDFDLPEPEVLLDLRGRPEAIIEAERNMAHEIIEDFMIAANEAVAEHMEARGVPSLYRIHEEPDPAKIEDSIRMAGGFSRIKARSTTKKIHSILEEIKGRRDEEAITYSILRSLKQARYSVDNVGHFGLASECYTHFTSPIRRYPDLVVHRLLKESISGRKIEKRRIAELVEKLPDMAFHSSRRERVAEEAEREAVNAMRLWFMKDKVGKEFDARVMRIGPMQILVRLREYYVEGSIPLSFLSDDYYIYDERTITLRGRHTGNIYSMGQDIRVRLNTADLKERRLYFSIVP